METPAVPIYILFRTNHLSVLGRVIELGPQIEYADWVAKARVKNDISETIADEFAGVIDMRPRVHARARKGMGMCR